MGLNLGFLNIKSSNKKFKVWRQIISKWNNLWQKLDFLPWVRPHTVPIQRLRTKILLIGLLYALWFARVRLFGLMLYPALCFEEDSSTTWISSFCESLTLSNFNWVWDTSQKHQISIAFLGSRNSRPRTWSHLMPHTILSWMMCMNVSVRTPNSQVFAFSRRSLTYKSILSFTRWVLLLPISIIYNHFMKTIYTTHNAPLSAWNIILSLFAESTEHFAPYIQFVVCRNSEYHYKTSKIIKVRYIQN